jgi:hypothetical protein
MILPQHIPIFQEIMSLQGFLMEPILSFGYQDVVFNERAKEYLLEKRKQKKSTKIYFRLRDEISRQITLVQNRFWTRVKTIFLGSSDILMGQYKI